VHTGIVAEFVAAEIGNYAEYLVDEFRRWSHGRLVKKNELWLGRQRPANCKHLLLTARQRDTAMTASRR
jgi:hypothetical protein